MNRGLFQGFSQALGGVIFFVLACIAGIAARSIGPFILISLIGTLVLIKLHKKIENAGRIKMDDWLASLENIKYSYAYDGTGIALDESNRILYLAGIFKGNNEKKYYNFSDVREWGYNIEGHTTYGRVIGGGMQGVSANIGASIATMASASAAKEKTGFWVKVADIDYPKWFIKFKPQKDLELELTRWMEIFQQKVNES